MKLLFKHILALLCALALLISAVPLTYAASEEIGTFTVCSTTDMHGHCWDKNLLNDTNEKATLLHVSTAMKQIRKDYDNVILVDNGDTYQGTPVSGFQIQQQMKHETDLKNPMAMCMKDIGYDYAVIGNHEFNYPWQTMEEIRSYLADESNGQHAIPSLSANIYYAEDGEGHKAGDNVMTPYAIHEISVADTVIKVAIIGFENTDCPRWDVPDNYPGMVFTHPENINGSMAWEADRYTKMAREDGADFVIVSYHAGIGSSAKPEDIKFGENSENQVRSMIENTNGIDFVIAGHDHTNGYSGILCQNKDGKDVMVVNGGCVDLTRTTFSVAANGTVTLKDSVNLPLSKYAIDTALKEKVRPCADMAKEYVNREIGKIGEGNWTKNTNFYQAQTDTIDLVGRAQIYAGSKYMPQKYDTPEKVQALYDRTGLDHMTVDFSANSVAVSANYTVQPGPMSMKDIYKFYRYDNTLYLLPVTGTQIREILENNARTHLSVSTVTGVPVFGLIGDSFTNPVFYGIDFTYDMAQNPDSRVADLKFADGREVEDDKVYIMALSNYHLGNHSGPFAEYSTTDTIWSQTDDLGGGTVQEMIADFIADETQNSNGVTPAPSNWSISYSKEVPISYAPSRYVGYLEKSADNILRKPVDGEVVAIYHSATDSILSNAAEGGKIRPFKGIERGKWQIGMDDLVNTFNVIQEDGHYLFQNQDGKYLTTKGMYTATKDEFCLWDLREADNGFNVVSVNDKSHGKEQALEHYWNGFNTYGLKPGDPKYIFNFFTVEEMNEWESWYLPTCQNVGMGLRSPVGHEGDPLYMRDPVCLAKTEECQAKGYNDVDTTKWYHGDVEFAIVNEIMVGHQAHFRPDAKLTRAEFAQVLYNIYGAPSVEGIENPFTDVKEGKWYYEAMLWATSKNIIKGMTETQAAPNALITREQVVVMIHRSAGEPQVDSADLSDFRDADKISDYAVEAMKFAVDTGLIGGDDGMIRPQGYATRAQIAAITHRMVTVPDSALEHIPMLEAR